MNRPRGIALTIFAILFALLAISNFMKPIEVLGHSGTPGFVFLGTRTSGIENDILGPTFGIILAVYAFGIWRLKSYALPLSYAYLAYVVLNLILFTIKNPEFRSHGGNPFFGLFYATIAIGVPLASAILLNQRRAELT
jgi:hypothetical protein